MRFLIISGNPKKEGLCHSVMEAIEVGAKAGGDEVQILYTTNIERCRVCGDGWGTCRTEGYCEFGELDSFHHAEEVVKNADRICILTPVYWWDMAEGLKSFLDKLRRCGFGQGGALKGKQVLFVASAGGTGNGVRNCLLQFENFGKNTKAEIFDLIGINRWNNDYQKQAAHDAAKAMAEGRKAGETI